MSVQNNGTPTRPGGITGPGFLPGQSGNPGGRPRGLAAAARAAVGTDGHDLIEFFAAIVRADRKYLGERRIALRNRMEAGFFGPAEESLPRAISEAWCAAGAGGPDAARDGCAMRTAGRDAAR